jgi:hypothetical protein
MGKACSIHGGKRGRIWVFVGKAEKKGLLGKARHRGRIILI